MIRNEFTALATFDEDIGANLARNLLETAKIKAYLSGESSNMLWHIGNGFSGVQLWVANEDVERARDVLNQPSESGRLTADEQFFCTNCTATIDLGFDVCWSCGSTAIQPKPADRKAWTVNVDDRGDNSVEVVGTDDEVKVVELEADNVARRAWISAIFGLFVFPFSFYSIYLLVKISGRELSPSANLKFFWAAIIDFTWLPIMFMLIFYDFNP